MFEGKNPTPPLTFGSGETAQLINKLSKTINEHE